MEELDSTRAWPEVHHSSDAGQRARYPDALSALSFFQTYKRRTFELLSVRPGHRILDVGCGTGDDARSLATLVGRSGRVIGIDSSAALIAEARHRAEHRYPPAEFCVGDAHHLKFADEVFDGVRADRALQHLDEPRGALAEMVRVGRPGARLVVGEPDWDTLVIDAGDRTLTRAILRFRCDEYHTGWVGRQLYRLLTDAGLRDVAVLGVSLLATDYTLADTVFNLHQAAQDAAAAGVVDREAAQEWIRGLEVAGRSGRFFGAATAFIASGRKG